MSKEDKTIKEDININEDVSELDELDNTYEDDNKKVENPFIELRHLISDKHINVKTILTEKQIIRLHMINTVMTDLDVCIQELNPKIVNHDQRKKSLRSVKKLLMGYTSNFMTLVINKEGKSREQFIEALHKGSDKAEEAKNARINKILGV